MKKFILSMIVCAASVVAYIGIYPTSWSTIYQPKSPPELLR
ncbi:cyclic lactone autoinducer peptide [Desulfoscipio gibsoniae]|uniref:Cyclic lactone autoinducer peptide n=1 Tax=Desulfoscipio gibsoniae DSM 7213 TaxID=767817 RepID=R4KQH4_9FIRM|nr:cyclic lactone autoinducer peptide [Desulfoscipio gibsoniae]AGL01891.1 hypothetical protein Desgi_2483 [Desulfoscipio gibsoniae DSM 7213]